MMLKTPDQALRIPLRIFHLVPEEKRRLGFIVFLIGIVHLILFFVLDIHYPAAQPTNRRRAEVFLASPELMGVESWNSTLFWNQMKDPSTLLHQTLIPLEKNPVFHPIFENRFTSNLPLLAIGSAAENPMEALLPLENRALEKMVFTPSGFVHPTELASIDRTTRVVFSKNLQSRKKLFPAEWPKPTVNLLNESGTTTLRVGVNAEGWVIHALVEEGSGSAATDQMALQEIRKIIFQPQQNQGLEWGSITFFWDFINPPSPAKEGP